VGVEVVERSQTDDKWHN